jgi:hypothetical protein
VCHIWHRTYVHKTTVYLPEELKRSLRQMAATTGRSEADLIREAIAIKVGGAELPRPRGHLFESGDTSLSEYVDEALVGFGDR